jgi:hypothetical protein
MFTAGTSLNRSGSIGSGAPTRLLFALGLGLGISASIFLTSACAAGRPSTGPHISPLNPAPARGGPNKPITIRGTVIDATTQRPIQLAHLSYDHRVVTSDANGSFSFTGVPGNQALSIVAAGYRRYNAVWNPTRAQIALTPFEVRGLYMPFDGLVNPPILATINRYTTNTEVNSIVLEIKTDDGEVAAQMATPAAAQNGASVQGVDVKGFVEKMHERGIYVIGRFVVFRDPTLAKAHPEYALKRVGDRQPYTDEQGQRWIDAFRQEVWQYNLDLAERAAQLGIDELQFDYVRFPGTDQDLDYAEAMTQENRVAAIDGYLKRAEQRLRPYGVALGADTFGLTTVANDDTGIGQDITTLGGYLDYYCPMVYPSTWADGSLGVLYPPAEPYTIVHDSVEAAVKRLANVPTVKVRPWLQAFDDYKRQRLDYGADKVNIQKEAAARGGGLGWMLWDPAAEYAPGFIGPATAAPTSSAR